MLENTEGVLKKYNPETLATLGAQEENKRNRKTQHNMCWTLLCASRNTLRKQDMRPTKQLEAKTNRASFFAKIVTDMTTM